MSRKQRQFDFAGSDAIKRLIKDAINDKTRAKINFQILDQKHVKSFKVEEIILPTHLTMGKIP